MKSAIYLVVVLLLASSTFAYPVIVADKGVDRALMKENLAKIDAKYLNTVQVIEFHNKPSLIWEGYARWWSDGNHIDIYTNDIAVIAHEIGHIYSKYTGEARDGSQLKSNEELADKYAKEMVLS
jgi:hypothetical protein